jgi:hypothetical protein
MAHTTFNRWLNQRLTTHGVSGHGGVHDAIRLFQRRNGLKESGVADADTVAALRNDPAPVPMPRPRPPPQLAGTASIGGGTGMAIDMGQVQPVPQAGDMPMGGYVNASPRPALGSVAAAPPMDAAFGPPPGVPLTGPGGSPAPQYYDDGFAPLLRMIPGYDQIQQPLPEYSTANSPLAGVDSYVPDAVPAAGPAQPTEEQRRAAIEKITQALRSRAAVKAGILGF